MTAEQIVRALAAANPLQTYEDDCALCAGIGDIADEHELDCPWRLAVEWVAAEDWGVGTPVNVPRRAWCRARILWTLRRHAGR